MQKGRENFEYRIMNAECRRTRGQPAEDGKTDGDARCWIPPSADKSARRAADKLAGASRNKRQGRPFGFTQGRRTKLPGFGREVIHPYKYMRIYLWSDLRTMVLRTRGGVDGLMPDSASGG